MHKRIILLLCLATISLCSRGHSGILTRTLYTPQDSTEVIRLLQAEITGNDVLHYARHFIGRPYVAHTLEVADPEQLVVNLRELDCTTLAETACALAMTRRQGGRTFEDFCHNLERLRYFGGHMDGYLSRLHYFTWWMHDNIRKGFFAEVRDNSHFCTPITVNNYYMSRHAKAYKMLNAHPEWTDSIAVLEKRSNGPDGNYLPERLTRLGKRSLSVIEDGDLIAIVTTKAGLDYSHLGFAVWGKDGMLHMLHASSAQKLVVEDRITLYNYLKKIPSSTGIRVLRLVDTGQQPTNTPNQNH